MKLYAPSLMCMVLLVHLLPHPGLSQDPGFFLDDWTPRIADIPESRPVSPPSWDATVEVTVDMGQEVRKVSRYIYGNNAVTWDNGLPRNPTAMTDLRNLQPNVLRWPGGNLSNNYFWNRSPGDRPADIPDDINPWYGMNTANWQMSLDEYYALLEASNSTGIICVNYDYARYGTGPDPVAAAAHLAAEWVRYDNGRTRFWEIGNENFGNWIPGYEIDTELNQDGQPRIVSGQLYGQHSRVFIDSMRAAAAEVGTEIKIGVVTYDAENSYDPVQTNWNEGMMPEVGDLADFLIVHSYFTPYDEDSPVSTILNSYRVPEEIMLAVESDMAEAGMPMLPVAMTEWNIFAVRSMQQVSYINGVLASLVLGQFAELGYGLAARWDLVNGWNNGDDHGLFSTGGEPGVDPYNPRAAFFYMYYFQKFFGDRMVHSESPESSQVVSYASSFSSGESGMVLINKGTGSETVEVTTENFQVGEHYYWYILTGGDDNGDFSRKVYINGTGTDEQGGGPDHYASLKAFKASTGNGIRVQVPGRSVAYLLLETDSRFRVTSALIEEDPGQILLEFSDTVRITGDSTGFSVRVNDTLNKVVTRVEINPADPRQMNLLLEAEILAADRVTLFYSGDGFMSDDSIGLEAIENLAVENLLQGAPPQVTQAWTSCGGDSLLLRCNMNVRFPDPVAPAFNMQVVNEGARSIALTGGTLAEGDSSLLVLTPQEQLTSALELEISYADSVITSPEGTPMEPFTGLQVLNQAPGTPPDLLSATVTAGGFVIRCETDKTLQPLSATESHFEVMVEETSFAVDSFTASGSLIHIYLNDYIRHGESVQLDYTGTSLTALDRGKLPPIAGYLVENPLPEPFVFKIPGELNGANYSAMKGMTLVQCLDEGGGENLAEIDAGDWVDYEAEVQRTGFYSLTLRVASASETGWIRVVSTDGEVPVTDSLEFSVTGGDQVWQSVQSEIILHEGRQRIRLLAVDPGANINWLNIAFRTTLEAEMNIARTNRTGDSITAYFNKELQLPPEIPSGPWSLQNDGTVLPIEKIFPLPLDDYGLVIVPTEALTPDQQNLTLSYEGGNLLAKDGTPVAFFHSRPVENQVNTSIPGPEAEPFSVYPNPASDHLVVESAGRDMTGLELHDITGKHVFSINFGDPRQKEGLTLSTDPGIYILKIRSDSGVRCLMLLIR